MSVAGRNTLITGGGSGLGAALALAFAEAGARVTITGRRADALEKVAGRADGITPAPADATDAQAMAALAERLGPFDIVIANAGAAESAPFLRTDPAHWQQMIGVNLTGTYTTFHATLAPMLEQGWGRLIAVASTAGIRGYAYATAYSAAKHGTVGLVRALAQETARKGVTVNALCPGFLDTEMTERSIARIRATTGMDAQEARRSLEAMSPQRRLIAPSEVVSAAMWLCGPGSEGVTGQTISISGGET